MNKTPSDDVPISGGGVATPATDKAANERALLSAAPALHRDTTRSRPGAVGRTVREAADPSKVEHETSRLLQEECKTVDRSADRATTTTAQRIESRLLVRSRSRSQTAWIAGNLAPSVSLAPPGAPGKETSNTRDAR